MRHVENKHIVVIGAARSGMAVAALLAGKGAEIFVSDKNPISDPIKDRLNELNIPFEENGHSERAREGELAVVSPGVPTQAPIVQDYLQAGKAVYSELEVASWYNRSPIIAVTGSNGKTTVTSWLTHLWKCAGIPHLTAGNIGYAFSDRVEETDRNTQAILEVSSFQLDHIDTFHPQVSMILNITPDHLDRYQQSFDKYAESKFKISMNQTGDDWFIFNYDDPVIKERVESFKKKEDAPRLLAFSNRSEVPEGAFVRNQEIVLKFKKKEEVLMPIDEIGLKGRHNLNNGLATALAARVSEIKNEVIRESLRSFEGVEHRLEMVQSIDGVQYVNDSKATNINAVWYALDSFNVPIVLILGGRDKGNDYLKLEDQLKEKVHTVIAIGEARPLIEEQLKEVVPRLETAETMRDAVRLGRKYAKRGEIVLLSPACASFDMFENYEHRGREFKKMVNEL
ncbi:MAG: UDP-N-acetylmuramoyl-L-alanine--D-glutamate ligase [Balneolaceae bacterium]|nr:UDP-N-acetylmuramoyl-L-alanine--D-glutamate ligase [Balneolaceae bacterium]